MPQPRKSRLSRRHVSRKQGSRHALHGQLMRALIGDHRHERFDLALNAARVRELQRLANYRAIIRFKLFTLNRATNIAVSRCTPETRVSGISGIRRYGDVNTRAALDDRVFAVPRSGETKGRLPKYSYIRGCRDSRRGRGTSWCCIQEAICGDSPPPWRRRRLRSQRALPPGGRRQRHHRIQSSTHRGAASITDSGGRVALGPPPVTLVP